MLTQQTIREIRRAVEPLGKQKTPRPKKGTTGFNENELNRFKQILYTFRDEAIRELQALRESSDMPLTEQTAQLIQRQIRLLNQLDAALNRIKDGTYGICRSCGERIESGRLEAVPHTQMCLSCKAL